MHSNLNLNTPSENSRVGLYSFVFASKLSLCLVLFLFASFFIQPVHLAYANDVANEIVAEAEAADATNIAADVVVHPEEPTGQLVSEMVEDPAPEEVLENEPAAADEDIPVTDNEESSDAATEEASDSAEVNGSEVATSTPDATETAGSSDTASSTGGVNPDYDNDDSEATTTVPVADGDGSTASTTDNSGDSSTTIASSTDAASSDTSTSDGGDFDDSTSDSDAGSESESDTNTDSPAEDASPDTSADNASDSDSSPSSSNNGDTSTSTADSEAVSTSSVPATETITAVESIVTDDNFYQFDKQSCVSVGEGSYHCSVAEGEVVDSQTVVYSEIGPSGSPEIFIRTALGEIKQVTDNNFEDSSPHYDAASQKIAWQRLIHGRYQIVIYDIETGKEKQLTFSRTNNMEPAVSTAGVVWQAWDNNDWEIMFYDGIHTDQITSNYVQDLAPVIEDDYIIWTVIGGGSQYAQVYSFDSKESVTINNHEGGSIVNPRFILVYDTKFDNGDVITQRFDPETGFAEAISARPAEEAPLEIPDADNTGEIRALIQTKSSYKQTVVIDGFGTVGTGTTGTTGSSTPDTLNLIELNIEQIAESVTTSTDGVIGVKVESVHYLELNEYDLILSPTQEPTATTSVPITNTSST